MTALTYILLHALIGVTAMYIFVVDLHNLLVEDFDAWKEYKKTHNRTDLLVLMAAGMVMGPIAIPVLLSENLWKRIMNKK